MSVQCFLKPPVPGGFFIWAERPDAAFPIDQQEPVFTAFGSYTYS